MARRLFSQWILNNNQTVLKPKISSLANFSSKKLHTVQGIPVKEVQIPVQWGHVAGKLWGTGSDRPILAVHGWQDNAGTWDPLIPLLYKEMNNNRPILAIDFPGHGLSSWLPPGMNYYSWELPRFIHYLKEYFKWDKVSILGHSMGSIAGFRYATVFPDDVDFYIAVDILIYDDYDIHFVVDKYSAVFKKALMTQKRLDIEPPSYTREEMIKKWHMGTLKSVALESVPYLLERGTRPSKQDPNKFYFSRDSRLKFTLFNPEDKKFVEALILRLKCPTLYIKAVDSPFAVDEFAVSMADMIAKNNEKYEIQYLPGTHHIHLNTPELVLPVIMQFLRKYNFV
ncbi:probable serine hydrolase [Pectinophora gossypiella]|uniref:probable serine hydrolase n=1 Tax=Pectinophora gossypiella TaxID=13191 RepID=UPI00214E5150|nr:probable serine hydrolase [Pectinophora gossypiella]